ncbi:hypothetical protein MWMV2_MWMV2_02119 [Acinetobacter oleivorans]|nr:hypothetical protein MWMV19_MWMV19_01126 [Acinetobacter oleivorans]CAI3140037.1 hypothetical protein MWMV3_MWMV3_02119 [Acinetobacter oleivorans]CAI3140567.1 hypothetical protein MWMV5_MWMV5_02119 [Acinetobacter oleivorans]CAI3140587.1 hypothetical protein MWMV13_MWMV13_02119 [Acinetobacter oleivorans]CAI3140589.1 hypothetical protein MWMV12_MWMV12_02119 [Acinetobacter oleivorans]
MTVYFPSLSDFAVPMIFPDKSFTVTVELASVKPVIVLPLEEIAYAKVGAVISEAISSCLTVLLPAVS